MSTLEGRSSEVAEGAVTPADTRLATAAAAMENAAWREGIDPAGPLGVFVVAIHRTLAAMAEMSEQHRFTIVNVLQDARAVTEAEIEKARLANQLAGSAIEQARTAHAGFEVQREKLIAKLVDNVVPQMVKAVGEAIVIRERRHNQKVQWGRAFGIAALGGGLLLGGFIWGCWQPSDSTIAGSIALDRIKRCQAAPVHDASSKETYCPMSILLSPT